MKYSCIFAIMPLIEVNVDKNRLKLETWNYMEAFMKLVGEAKRGATQAEYRQYNTIQQTFFWKWTYYIEKLKIIKYNYKQH